MMTRVEGEVVVLVSVGVEVVGGSKKRLVVANSRRSDVIFVSGFIFIVTGFHM